jgi:hypothetical protein
LAARRARAMGEDLLDRYLRVTIDPPQPVLDSSEPATGARPAGRVKRTH